MRGKVFASGGGNAKNSYLLDREFVNSLKNHKILYIPIGLRRDIVGFEGCYNWITETLKAHTSKEIEIEMWINLKDKHEEDLSVFDAIYIGGAYNTYKLMDILHRSGLNQKLREFVIKGGSIYGGSSGAIILGKNIATWGDDKIDNGSEDGLDLVNGFSIFCHFNIKGEEHVKNYINKYKIPTIALTEDTGFIYEENNIKAIGYDPVVIFYGSENIKLLKPNEEVSLAKI
jgi:dipeptidase E